MKHVRDVIEGRTVVSARPDQKVIEVVRTMTEKRIGAMPVLDGSKLAGIFTERDLMTRVVAKELSPADTPVSDVMTSEVASTGPDEELPDCIEKMQDGGYRHLPVVENDSVIGMISLRDVLSVDRNAVRRQKKLLTELVKDDPIYDG